MTHIYNSLKELLTPDLISDVSAYLHEDRTKVVSAIESTVSGLFFSVLPQENSTELEFAIRKAGRAYPNIISGLHEIFTGKANEKTYYAGSRFLDALFENRINTFTSLISNGSGLSIRSADKLISILAPVVAGLLGNTLLTEKLNFTKLLQELEKEKDSYQASIPSELSELLEIVNKPATSIPFSINPENVTNIPSERQKVERGFNLGKWITLLIVVIVIIYCWQTCG